MIKSIFQNNVFEGKNFRKLLKLNKKSILYYKELNLNKIWLSDLIPNYTNEYKISYFKKINQLLKLVTKIFFYEYNLIKKNNGKDKIWILLSNSVRKSHLDFIKSEEKSIENPSIVSWERKFKIKKVSKIINQIKYSYLSIKYSKKIFKNSNYLKIAYNTLVSIDLFESKILNKPSAILSLKDFQRYENAIIQKSNLLKIPTFVTQHTVHPNYIGKNERGGNLVFFNSEAKNILLWGNFLKQSYKQYHNDKKFYFSKNFILPYGKKIILRKKKGILFFFGSKRHIYENLSMIKLLFKNKTYFKENFEIFIKLHPAISSTLFNKYFKKYLAEYDYKILLSKNVSNKILVNSNLFAVTGLSGSYYDCIYLGLKTLFFDYGIELSNKLPRVTNNLKLNSNLKTKLFELEKIPNKQWKKKSDNILKKVWGIGVNEKSRIRLTDEISKIIS